MNQTAECAKIPIWRKICYGYGAGGIIRIVSVPRGWSDCWRG